MSKTPNLVVFCDYENVALGAKESGLKKFDINLVLERFLETGSVVLKKAYADWSRYRNAKKPLHEAGFELIEIPHVSYSGKNSADIRLVVDALDLCYTKPHVDTFAIISGDSDFSPLVAKLRENNKHVLGLGVRASTSNLLTESCDSFVYYDDLVRQRASRHKKRRPGSPSTGAKKEAVELVVATAEALLQDRDEPVWASHVKQVLKRKQPGFTEGNFGYAGLNDLLEDADEQGLVKLQKDIKSGGYIILSVT